MQWKRGDKCILNEAVMSQIIKSICPESYREPEQYSVIAVDPVHAVVIIAGKENRLAAVLATWIVPYNDPAWNHINSAINQCTTPADLLKRLENKGDKEHEGK
jgi:hypothetical protein